MPTWFTEALRDSSSSLADAEVQASFIASGRIEIYKSGAAHNSSAVKSADASWVRLLNPRLG